MALWHDYTRAATVTKDGSNKVSQVLDLSGNGLHGVQSNSSRQPSHDGTRLTISSTPSVQNLVCGTNSTVGFLHQSAGTLVAVIEPTLDEAITYLAASMNTTGPGATFIIDDRFTTSSLGYRMRHRAQWRKAGSVLVRDTTTVARNDPYDAGSKIIATWRWSASLIEMFHQFALLGSIAPADTFETGGGSEAALYLGSNPSNGSGYTGHLYELVVYNKTLGDGEMGRLWRHLGGKHGI